MIGNFVFTETSPSAPGTVASSQPVQNAANYLPAGVCGPLDDWEALDVIIEIQGATGGALAVYLQGSPDGGSTWYDLIAWPSATAASPLKFYQSPLSLATTTSYPVLVGKNLVPALVYAAPTGGNVGTGVVNGAFSDRVRLVMVAGVGTTAGSVVVCRIAPQRVRVREHGE